MEVILGWVLVSLVGTVSCVPDNDTSVPHVPQIPEHTYFPLRSKDGNFTPHVPFISNGTFLQPISQDGNSTFHVPFIPEGTFFPLSADDPLSLASVTILDDGSVVIPPSYYHQINQKQLKITTYYGVMCGEYQVSAGQTVRVTSPNFPQRYNSNFYCVWTFTAPMGSELNFKCDAFALDRGRDWLGVKHSSSGEIRYKRYRRPKPLTTTGGELRLRFLTNRRDQRQGFSCTVQGPPLPTTTTTTEATTTTQKTTTTPESTTTVESTSTTEPPPIPLSHPYCGVGVDTARIVNGETTGAHQYPWMAWLTLRWSDGGRRCGGTIIHQQWIMTAAHCPFRVNSDKTQLILPVSVIAEVGGHRQGDPGAHGGYVVQVDTSGIHMHPKYRLPYDIALLKLQSPLTLTPQVRPVCLAPRAWATNDMAAKPLTVSGWGKTESGSIASELRQYATFGYPYLACNAYYGGWMLPTQMCTDGSARKHTCSGDSGGPVMRAVGGLMVQVGVVSFGATSECQDQSPDGQVRVAAFIDWFQDVTGLTFAI